MCRTAVKDARGQDEGDQVRGHQQSEKERDMQGLAKSKEAIASWR